MHRKFALALTITVLALPALPAAAAVDAGGVAHGRMPLRATGPGASESRPEAVSRASRSALRSRRCFCETATAARGAG